MRKIIRLSLSIIWISILFFVWNIALQANSGTVNTPCDSKDCINSPNFEISVWTFGSTTLIDEDSAGGTVNNILMTVLEKLILIFWACAIFIMTIGAWYMIIYHGQDEFLSKWKSIFMSGIIALVVALSAWIIVRLFSFLLY